MDFQIHYLPFAELPTVERGQNIVNYPIVSRKLGSRNIKSGITRVPAGAVVSRHSHNAEEQVTVLEGKLRIVLGDQSFDCGPYDSTFISAGVPHEFTNIGDGPSLVMVILALLRICSDAGAGLRRAPLPRWEFERSP